MRPELVGGAFNTEPVLTSASHKTGFGKQAGHCTHSVPSDWDGGVDQHLWRWLKAQAALEGKTIGQKLNEILAFYKGQAETS